MANYQFKIGELAIAVGRPSKPKSGCQIVDYFKHPFNRDANWYLILVPGFKSERTDKAWFIEECNLRKKQPPEDTKREMDRIVSWKDCVWQPQAVQLKENSHENRSHN